MQDGTNKTPRPRGRPRAYDPAVVAGRIVDTFWTCGYAATSLDQLAAATGMNRPSLYAAFGDKKSMYRGALDAFATQVRREVEAALAAPRIAVALREFYRGAIAVYLSGESGPRGCLFVCTAAVEAVNDADIRGDIGRVLQGIDSALEARIKSAQQAGEIGSAQRAGDLARVAGAVLHSLAIRARTGTPKRQLERLADALVQLITTAG